MFPMGEEAAILDFVQSLYATALEDEAWTASLDALSELKASPFDSGYAIC